MYPKIRHVTIDCTGDPYYLAQFWNTVLGWPLADDDKPGDPEALLTDPDGAPGLLFIQVPEGKSVKNRIHFDIQPPAGRSRDEEVERVLGLGARMLDDRRDPCGRGWAVFADPEGNEFCVEASKAEYEKFKAEGAQAAGAENEG